MKIKFFLLATATLAMVSCSSSKSQSGPDTEFEVPCSGYSYSSDHDTFRSSAMGQSKNLEIAAQKAMTAARSKLATSIETTVKTVTDNYLSSYEVGTNEEARSRFQSMTREAASQTLRNVRTICNKTTQSSDGMYKSYVALEVTTDALEKDIVNGISNDEKLRTDFEYEKFKEVFNEEMAKLESER